MFSKKSITFLFLALFLAACGKELPNTHFINKGQIPFSLKLPAAFYTDQQTIWPRTEGEFPTVFFSFSEEAENSELIGYLEKEKAFQTERCKAQPEDCAEVSEGEVMQVRGVPALKYTVKYPSKDLEGRGEYVNNYQYSFKQGNDFLHLWIYAGDLENPEQAQMQLDQIVQTIEFTGSSPTTPEASENPSEEATEQI